VAVTTTATDMATAANVAAAEMAAAAGEATWPATGMHRAARESPMRRGKAALRTARSEASTGSLPAAGQPTPHVPMVVLAQTGVVVVAAALIVIPVVVVAVTVAPEVATSEESAQQQAVVVIA
jgi:hypothetical protein